MFARSIYISQFGDNFKVDENCSTYFTSFHIAEEFNDEFKTKAEYSPFDGWEYEGLPIMTIVNGKIVMNKI